MYVRRELTSRIAVALIILAFLAGGCSRESQSEPAKGGTAVKGISIAKETGRDQNKKDQHAGEKDSDHEGEKHDKDAEEHGHEEEGEEHHGRIVKLKPAEIKEFGIVLKKAGPGNLNQLLAVTGEVVLNPDKVVHVQPRVPGVVRAVFKSVGDAVTRGEILAVLDSAALAKAKSAYLEALTREELAKTNYEREEKLWNQQVSSEKDYLEAKQALREAEIRRQQTERALHALGLSEHALKELPKQRHKDLTRYEMTSPMDGAVINRHLVRGEVLRGNGEEPPFVVADMSSVWVNLTIHQKDLTRVRKGQKVDISSGKGLPETEGVIDYVSPTLAESTRTATARVVLNNNEGHWRPGLFVTAYIRIGEEPVDILVPRSAVMSLDGSPVVFVKTDEGFEPRQVQKGRSDRKNVEIVKGLARGELYVAEKGFTLKAELKKASFAGEGHSH